MESQQNASATDRLALLEVLLAGQERRYEVMDVVWNSRDEGEAVERLRRLLGGTGDLRVVLDMRLGRLTGDERKRLAHEAEELRRLVEEE